MTVATTGKMMASRFQRSVSLSSESVSVSFMNAATRCGLLGAIQLEAPTKNLAAGDGWLTVYAAVASCRFMAHGNGRL